MKLRQARKILKFYRMDAISFQDTEWKPPIKWRHKMHTICAAQYRWYQAKINSIKQISRDRSTRNETNCDVV